jgi:hypothetical protein
MSSARMRMILGLVAESAAEADAERKSARAVRVRRHLERAVGMGD